MTVAHGEVLRRSTVAERAVRVREVHVPDVLDADSLEHLASLYPHSDAAASSRQTRLEWALASSDAKTVVRMARQSFTGEPRLVREDAELLLVLAEALAESGNSAARIGILSRVAKDFPDARLSNGRTVGEVYEAWPTPRDVPLASERNRFDDTSHAVRTLRGPFEVLGELP